MQEQSNISKDPRIMNPLAELLKKIHDILNPSPSHTKSQESPPSQDLSSPDTTSNQ